MGKVVLVHGAWHGSWCWDAVVAELAAKGVEVEAIELPLTSYQDDVEVARQAVAAAGEGAVVCGHSYGGLVISAAAADQPGVARLVYLCAFMTDEGEDPFVLSADDPPLILSALVFDDRGMTVDPAQRHQVFYADSDPSVVDQIAPKLRPMPAGESWLLPGPPAWKKAPSTYVVCSKDNAIPPSLQRTMSTHATDVVEWDNDHSPFLNRPGDVADLLASYT